MKPLQKTMVMASSVPSSSPLSKLKDMNLWDIEDDGGSLPDGWVLNLNSLKSLGIINYPRLTSMSGAMRYLTSLEELQISDCDEFDPLSDMGAEDDGMEWRHLNSLHTLFLRTSKAGISSCRSSICYHSEKSHSPFQTVPI